MYVAHVNLVIITFGVNKILKKQLVFVSYSA